MTEEEDKPPFLGSWRNIYLAVMGIYAIVVLLFLIFTNTYS